MNTALVGLKSGGQITPIIPSSIEEVYRLAKYIESSGLAPHGMQTAEQITVAILHGLEIGLPPMQAVQRIAVINGRATLWGDAAPALLLSRGFKLVETLTGKGDARVASCTLTRPDGATVTRMFTVTDALQAGLWQTQSKVKRRGKDGSMYEKENDSPWYRYPERMLQMRARGFAVRDGAADVLSGLYLREEIDGGALVVDSNPAAPAKTHPTGLLDIPDVPDVVDVDDAAIIDPAALVAKIKDDLACATDDDSKAEVAEQYRDIIDRLPDDWKGKANAVLETA